jgi:hypothetical protein
LVCCLDFMGELLTNFQVKVATKGLPGLRQIMLRESRANGGILVCDNYLIFYRYEDKIVFVSRILSSRRNYTHILFGDLPEDGRDC